MEAASIQAPILSDKQKRILQITEKLNPIQYHPISDLNLGKPVGSGFRDDLKIDMSTHNWSTGLQTGSGLMIGSPKIQQKQ